MPAPSLHPGGAGASDARGMEDAEEAAAGRCQGIVEEQRGKGGTGRSRDRGEEHVVERGKKTHNILERKRRKLGNSKEMGCKEGCDGQKMSKTWWSPSLGPFPSLSTCGKGFLVSGVRGWARS